MTNEKWQSILGNIKDNFTVEEEGKTHEDEMGGTDIEFIIFKGPLGRMKLELISKPVVLDKKTTYSRRIGAETQVKYIYSENEKSCKLKVYKWEEAQEDWVEMEAGMFDK